MASKSPPPDPNSETAPVEKPAADLTGTAVDEISALDVLETLMQTSGPRQAAARAQFLKVLSGSMKSDVPSSIRVSKIKALTCAELKQVALIARCREAARAAIDGLEDNQDLADLCLFAASVHVRRPAAQKLRDKELMADLLARVDGKDKTVSRILKDRLADSTPPAPGPVAEPKSEPKPVAQVSQQQRDLETFLVKHQKLFDTLSSPVTESEVAGLAETAAKLPEALLEKIRSPDGTLSGEPLRLGRLLAAAASLQVRHPEIAEIASSISHLSFKQARQLATTRNRLRRLMREIGWPRSTPVSAAIEEIHQLDQQLIELGEKNQSYQQQLVETTTPLIEALRQHLDAGNSNDASQAWDRIQGVLSNLNGQFASKLKEDTAEFRAKIHELRDWKNFAATEKKKELIEQMRHLEDSKMNPPDRARQIKRLHQDWKQLGKTSQNEQLWKDFKTLSDQAYAPCKEHFSQQKQQMAHNLKQRTEICNQLESYLGSVDRDNVRIADLKQLERQANDDWKRFAPVEQSKIRKLQKRFYNQLNEVRAMRRTLARNNAQLKQSLVAQATQLVSLEDQREAMNKAKSLQAEWKTIGPSSFKDDKKLWEEFRAACDTIFNKHKLEKKEFLSEIEDAVGNCRTALDALDQLGNRDDEAFRESRKEFSNLKSSFQNALSSRIKKERKQLLDRFNSLTRKIESRFNALPDRKTAEALERLSGKAALCLELESRLMTAEGDNVSQSVLSEVDVSSWEDIPGCGKPEFDQLMSARFNALRKLKSRTEFDRLLEKSEQQARQQVIELEIKADVDSPAADRQLRMEIQLNQLQNNFGKGKLVDPEQTNRYARDFSLAFLCMGPLSRAAREELQDRVDRAIARLL